jgi:ATP-dependent protease ClpP protease subunit
VSRTPEELAREAQRALFAKEPDGRYEVEVTAQADGSTKARVQIFGVIGDWWDGLDAATLATQIAALDTKEIEVHLNSPGGIAFDGLAIRNALAQHEADVHVVVDGLAASAASIVATAGDKVTMAVGAQMMLHDASGLCFGNAADMAKTAEMLDKISDSMADVYADHAGGTRADWRDVMLAETWYTADEAVSAGLADKVEKTAKDDKAKGATNAFDLSIFAYAGRDSAPAPHMPPAPPADHLPTSEGDATMADTLAQGLRDRLGITAELDEGGLLAAVDEALAERAEPTNSAAPGTQIIDQGTLAQLQADAALGRAAHEQQATDRREAQVRAALTDGRIPAASADHWRALLKADPNAATVLESLAKGTVPVSETGNAGGLDEDAADHNFDADVAAFAGVLGIRMEG